MGIAGLLLMAIGLSMDAFAVAICKGLSLRRTTLKNVCTVGLWFGGFQALMPVLGYLLSVHFKSLIINFNHWVAFGLLALIGANMIRESFSSEPAGTDYSLSFKSMLMSALATSVDALAVGITLAALDMNIFQAAAVIGVTTFLLSAAGTKVGSLFGEKYKSKAELVGGIILILLGIKILLEHLNVF